MKKLQLVPNNKSQLTRLRPFNFAITLFASLVVNSVSQAYAATVTFSDGVFASADWQISNSDVGSISTYWLQYSAGNPAPSLRFYGTIDGNAGSQAILSATYLAEYYNPSIKGAIIDMSFSLDTINTQPSPVAPMPFGGLIFGLFQDINNDGYFEGFSLTSPVYDEILGSWTSASHTGLTASNFDDGYGNHPDFSSSGGNIYFSFTAGTPYLGNNFNSPMAFDFSLDNWTVSMTTNTVPLPPAIWLFGTGLAGLFGIVRRK